MKKSIVFAILMVLCAGVTSDVSAKGKKTKTKKPATTEAASTTTVPAVTTATPAAPVAEVPFEDTGVATSDAIVADIDSFNFNDIVLDTTKPTDGYMKLANLKGAKPFPFPKNDKNSAKFYKRIWREIRTTDSENKIFSMPNETLIEFLMEGIKNGKVIAYADEGFKKKLTYKQVRASFTDSATISIQDTTGEISTKRAFVDFNPDSVTKFEIKEDIFFDKVRGRVITEIIGLGPVKIQKTSTGEYVSDMHPFYLNFKQCRALLAAREVVDPQRDIYNISFDDIFIQRAFKSTIIKESNPADLKIRDKYSDRERQIKEANRIEREIARYKRNLWKF